MAHAHGLSISAPNDEWVQAQVDNGAFSSRSEVINDLIREARETEVIRRHLIAAEQSGFTDKTGKEILASIHEQARRDGRL